MHRPRLIDDETVVLPECDREQLAMRNQSGLDTDVVSTPLNGRRQESTADKSPVSPLLPLWGVMVVGLVDWITSRALGAHLALSLFMLIPIYFAVQVVGTRSGLLVAASGGLFCLVLDVFALSTPQPRFFHVGLAATHLALYATAIAWAMDRRRLLAERALSTTDFLTGVANRRGFYQTLTHEIERSRRYQTPMTLLYLDCDEFKVVNDTMGHPAGNKLLARIAALLRESMRAVDVVGRLGGDEFAVILAQTPAERGAEVVARLRREMRSALGPGTPTVTMSIGAITFDSPPSGPNEAIRVADALMYEAKRSGKDRVVHATAGSADQRLKEQRHVA